MADSGNIAAQQPWAGILKNKPAGPAPSQLPQAHVARESGIEGRRVFVAVSPAMREVRRQVEQIAGVDAVVLLLGESGTGKEVIARMIHRLSSRAAGKFFKINCAGSPLELLESEMFGHEAGAFPGARQMRAGKFEICNKGTILLDEFAEMPLSPQAKLVQLLQDGEFSRLGGVCTIQSDVRLLAATNMDTRLALQKGTLRADLYYRLNVLSIHLPPLRERREDIPHLLNHFMTLWAASYGRPRLPVTRRILEACLSYPWPGNVRELENFVKRYLVLGDEKLTISQMGFRPSVSGEPASTSTGGSPVGAQAGKTTTFDLKSLVKDLKKDAERTAIVDALKQTGGSRQDAAGLLHISLRGLHYKIRSYGIDSIPSQPLGSSPQRKAPAPRPVAAETGRVCGFPRAKSGKLISMDRPGWPPTGKLY